MVKIHEGLKGAGGQLRFVSLVDAISSSNQMAKHRNTVSATALSAESKMSRPPATRAAAAACTQE